MTSVNGAIAIKGIGNGMGNHNFGVFLNEIGKIESTGTDSSAATINITGIGGAGDSYNFGVCLTDSEVISRHGDVTIHGTGGAGKGTGNAGVIIGNKATVQVATGRLTVVGTAGSEGSSGLVVADIQPTRLQHPVWQASGLVPEGGLGGARFLSLGSGRINLTGTGNGSSSTTSDILLSSDATIAAATRDGAVTTGAVTVQSGGRVAPGTAAGTLNTGDVSFSRGSFLDIGIGGTTAANHDQLVVAGKVSLAGATLTTTALDGFVPVAGNTFAILLNDGDDPIAGTFDGLAEGGTIADFLGSGLRATISYTANADSGPVGNDVVLTVE